jgi:hypothetical protein
MAHANEGTTTPRRAIARRRRSDADPLRKTGWQVRTSVADAVKEAVDRGAAESQNAFVERVLVQALKDMRRQRIYDAYAEAAADPVFMADMQSVTGDFDVAVGDGLTRSDR